MDKKGFFDRLAGWFNKEWTYWSDLVWTDPRNTVKVKFIKTVSLTVKTFFNADMQNRACSMTYQMMLAVVPALALIVAIGRGFGLQGLLEDELFKMFPAQHTAVKYAMNFVDSYLNTSTEGLFVGVGILFLLYTLISLFSSIEDTFNIIWCVKEGRSIGRKITDYTAMMLILPVVMVCAGGLSMMLTSTLQSIFDWNFITPLIEWIFEGASWFLTIVFFTLLYKLMPNTKVNFKNAFIAGIFAGIGFLILQWLFVSGQLYVSKYNAIYGSFSFLPLMLLWMQFTWIIIFTGGIICYSSQNISQFNFNDQISKISATYYAKLTLAVCYVVIQRFVKGKGATQAKYLTDNYYIPSRLVSLICERLVDAKIFSVTEIDSRKEIKGYQPALDVADISIFTVYNALDNLGAKNFIKITEDNKTIDLINQNFPGIEKATDEINSGERDITSNILIKNIEINLFD